MKLTELYLNRYLYRDNSQNLETKDSVFVSADSTTPSSPTIPSGGAAQDINTGNVQINGAQLEPGTYPMTVLDVSNWGWGQTCAFSSTDLDTVSWGAGTFTSADGTSYAISAGNTGNMVAKTYIYLSLLDSTTAYQTTTVPGNSVGIGKVLVAVANPDVVSATYNLSQATQIVGDNILANSINASKIITGQLIVGTNVGLGTAQDAGGVTTIIGNTITTGYISALGLVVGTEIGLGTAQDASGVTTIIGNTITTGYISALGLSVGTEIGLGKAKQNFTSTPTTPYYVGDLWSGGSAGDLKVCITQRLTGSYNSADWGLASKYTDNTVANSAVSGLNTLISDLGSVAYLNLVEAAQLGTTVITGGHIATSLLTADNILTGSLSGNLIQTSTSANTGVKMSSALGGLNAYGQNISIYDTAGTLYGYLGGYAGYFNLQAVSGRNMLIGASNASVIFANDVATAQAGGGLLGSSSAPWNSIYGGNMLSNNYYNSAGNQRIYFSSSIWQSSTDFKTNGSISLTGNLTFINDASITINGRAYYQTTGAYDASKYYLRSA